ncbi:MAG: TlpA family protein disulfide reductase [Candidatus Thermoplasmatota archaeon]|nr:TlpA family protein disulfide reductase [Candidatus Thermoplasmatota archaeon]
MGRSYSEKMKARSEKVSGNSRPRRRPKKANRDREGFPVAPIVVISIILLLIVSTIVMFIVQNTKDEDDRTGGDGPDDETTGHPAQTLIGIESVDRGVITLEEHIGKVVVLDMFATWCSPCRQQMYELIDLQSMFPRSQVVIVSVDTDLSETLSQVRDFKDGYTEAEWTFAVSNADLNSYFPASSIPTLYILDRNGRTASTHVGLTSAEDIASEVRDLL